MRTGGGLRYDLRLWNLPSNRYGSDILRHGAGIYMLHYVCVILIVHAYARARAMAVIISCIPHWLMPLPIFSPHAHSGLGIRHPWPN